MAKRRAQYLSLEIGNIFKETFLFWEVDSRDLAILPCILIPNL